jgi:hypothetical protein
MTYNHYIMIMHRKQFTGILLIAIFLARAFIPVGYMLSDEKHKEFSGLNLLLCPSQNNFSLDSTLTNKKTSTGHHADHHKRSSTTEEVNHNDGVTIYSNESCSLWSGSNALVGIALLPPYGIEYSRTSISLRPASSPFNHHKYILPDLRAPPTSPI